MDLQSHASSIGALADDTRRALYEYVVAQPEPVGREQAATALGLRPHTVAFHLDRLVEEGLLEVEFRRLTGRSGPGAGRPSKLYRRADRHIEVSLPPRHYDLLGDILAAAVTLSADGEPMSDALREAAYAQGVELGHEGREQDQSGSPEALMHVLRTQGFEPQLQGDDIVLTNCPFDSLAKKHTDLVCGVNVDFVQGVADGVGCACARARLEPEPGYCCVKASVIGA